MISTVLFAADTASSQRVYIVVVLLVVVGVAFAGLAWWLVRATKVDHELLAPLERMSEKDWLSTGPAERMRLLDDVRPDGAEPLERSRQVPAVDPDLSRAGPPASSLDDLPSVTALQQSQPARNAGGGDPLPAASAGERRAEERQKSTAPRRTAGGAGKALLPPPSGLPAPAAVGLDPLLPQASEADASVEVHSS